MVSFDATDKSDAPAAVAGGGRKQAAPVRVVLTEHFKAEMAADRITLEEITRAWTAAQVDRPSRDHPGARVRTATQEDGSRVTVVAKATVTALVFITCWRNS